MKARKLAKAQRIYLALAGVSSAANIGSGVMWRRWRLWRRSSLKARRIKPARKLARSAGWPAKRGAQLKAHQ